MHHPEGSSYGPERIASAVEDGLSMLRFSTLMALKNRIITTTLREGQAFEVDRARELAREEIAALADEQRDNARITRDALSAVPRRRRRRGAENERDYQPEDRPALEARGIIYDRLAQSLDTCLADVGYLDELVESARLKAWEEIGDAIAARLERTVDPDEAGYDLNRDLRIRYLKEVDLRVLERAR